MALLPGIPYPLVNGVRHSWSSVSITVAGLTYGGVTEVNYESTLEPGITKGAGPLIIGFTTGAVSMTADFTILQEEWGQLQTSLGAGFMTAFFDVEVTIGNEGYVESAMSTFVDGYKGRISKLGAAMSSGSADALVRKVSIAPIEMRYNGVSPFPNMPSISIGGVAGQGLGIARRIVGI